MMHLEGQVAVRSALESGRRAIDSVLLRDDTPAQRYAELCELASRRGVPVRQIPAAEFDDFTHGRSHGGVAAACRPIPLWSPEEILARVAAVASAGHRGSPLLLLLEGADDPRNLGHAIRTAEALAVTALLLRRRAWDFDEAEVARAASGALDRLPICVFDDLALIDRLRGRATPPPNSQPDAAASRDGDDPAAASPSGGLSSSTGTSVRADAETSGGGGGGVRVSLYGCIPGTKRSIYEAALTGPACIAIGGEKRGLSAALRGKIDRFVSIPTVAGAASLSMTQAAAVVLGEAVRQRWTLARPR